MSPAATPTLRQRELARRLRQLRLDSGKTVAEVADNLLVSQAKVSRIETGARQAQLRDVRDLCGLYGVKPEIVEELMALARQARERGWWASYDLASELDVFVGLEGSAEALLSFESGIVPGLLQTETYARALLRSWASLFPSRPTDDVVRLRSERQRRLLADGGPDIWIICDESVLHRPVGGHGVLEEQVAHMLEVTESVSNLTFQILPLNAESIGVQSSFVIMKLAPEVKGDVVYLEGLGGEQFLERPEELRRYERAFDLLRARADSPERSRQRLRKHLSDPGAG